MLVIFCSIAFIKESEKMNNTFNLTSKIAQVMISFGQEQLLAKDNMIQTKHNFKLINELQVC